MGQTISITVNGRPVKAAVDDAMLLSEFIRERLALTGTHVGCDTSQCGACTVHLDGRAVKSCAVLAARVDGCSVTTIEGVARPNGALHPVQDAFREHHALQCGYCTPGMIMSALDLVKKHPSPSKALIRKELEGNLCRCTGYANIVEAIHAAAGAMARS